MLSPAVRLFRFVLALACALTLTQALYPKGGGLPKLIQSQAVWFGSRGLNEFGWNAAMQGDVAAVVSPYGSATVIFERNGSSWNGVATAPASLGVATDGTRVAVQTALFGGSDVEIWIGPSPWSVEDRITPGASPTFGRSLGIFGGRLAVSGSDAVEIWEELGGTWSLAATLTGSDAVSGDEFGRAVSLYDRVAVAGAPEANGARGAAYVFQKVGPQWIEVAKLEAPGAVAGLRFGADVAVHQGTLAVGAPGYSVDPDDRGAVFTYRQVGPTWSLVQTLVHQPGGGWPIGSEIDLDDEWLIAGRKDSSNFNTAKTAPIWHLRSGVWTPVAELTSSLNFPNFPWAGGAAVQPGWAVVGTPGPNFDGVAQFYPLEPPPETFCTGKLNSDGCVGRIASCGLPSVTQNVAFDVGASDVLGQKPGLLIYGYGTSIAPFLGGTLCIQPPIRRTPTTLATGDATPCSGAYAFDFDALIKGGTDPFLVAGAEVVAQYWHRDPAASFGAGLTDALALTIWP